ncbi:putative H+-ATPase subunit [Monocercomonoides exilis]|uniref:putative H+-ATPase subunit n=1 Tax=Monocercomonoides exilis TaxID=2049356 RepID=UPI00355A5B19|nr:putative H+-ATPase subunit [Monocercomonoides exilis]|eukprot:MONOS_12033.1-p1 / transcript=MONOS_12033.1 / gene=MONOS_12033 / organism=Monocercomonoides_exilis_PA203 / gene_product=vacuolar H / transcript_product=vacuolar H / location=Mono_scaffold00638:2515-5596(+) / protein_length=925 / sequence_SO=supercontig / SO=protein_coding / is_pseudo=false
MGVLIFVKMSDFMSRFKDTTGQEIHMFRSEPMDYLQFVFPREAAYQTIHELGKLGIVHFEDMNPSLNSNKREFIGEIKRCDEMQRHLRYFRAQVVRARLEVVDDSTLQQFSFSDLEAQFEDIDTQLREHNINLEAFKRHENELIELRHVLKLGAGFFDKQPILETDKQPLAYQSTSSSAMNVKIGFIAGVIPKTKIETFQRMCYVVTRGNVFVNTVPIEEKTLDASSSNPIDKEVFVVFFSGEFTRNRIIRIAESLSASVYTIRESEAEREAMLTEIEARLADIKTVINKTEATLNELLDHIRRDLNQWTAFVISEKQLFHTLNKFSNDTISKCLVGEGWVPTRSLSDLQDALHRASIASSSSVPSIAHIIKSHAENGKMVDVENTVPVGLTEGDEVTVVAPMVDGEEDERPLAIAHLDAAVAERKRREMRKRRSRPPPTFIRTTKVTQAFQAIVNAYGTADYREVNPGMITFVTFPFLFAIMFGDFGHGILLFLVGLFFVLFEKKMGKGMNDLVEYLYVGRYMLVFMGLWAVFTGLMYNECFSLSMNFFGSSYDCDPETNVCQKKYTYFLGFDPIWRQCTNNLIFSNSIKMKLSVIIGVAHMIVGILFKGANDVYFKNKVNLYCEFIPQIILMTAMFGYMDFMIIYKWLFAKDPQTAPMLIRTMINMFLAFNEDIPPNEKLYPGQDQVQRFLLLLIVISIPWMLIPKPAILIYQHIKEGKAKKAQAASGGYESLDGAKPGNLSASASASSTAATNEVSQSASSSSSIGSSAAASRAAEGEDDDEEEEFNIGEMCVHQMIETIEFSLSCVSNTASYLRLWALSLAHGQLAEVFFDYGMIKAGEIAGFFGAALGVAVWLVATIGILLAMEGLSAFLHCLRLHWVELQNKFYKATGRDFEPLSFKELIDEEERNNLDFESNEKEKLA